MENKKDILLQSLAKPKEVEDQDSEGDYGKLLLIVVGGVMIGNSISNLCHWAVGKIKDKLES